MSALQLGAGGLARGISAGMLNFGTAVNLPVGVTLQAIDGEEMLSPTEMTNNYYARNGFSVATNSGFNGTSWDSPDFFPIGFFYAFYYSGSSDITAFNDLGFNTALRVTGGTNLSTMADNGIWVIEGWAGSSLENGAPNNCVVGYEIDEPASLSDISGAFSGIGSADLSGRFALCTFTWNQAVYETVGSDTMAQVLTTDWTGNNNRINATDLDLYWFAGSTVTSSSAAPYDGQQYYGTGSLLTSDQCARGSNYGDLVDTMRHDWQTTYSIPIYGPFVETDNGLLSDPGNRDILPPELDWAVWSTLIHGSRMVTYFTRNNSSGYSGGVNTMIQSGQSVSIYDQVKATNSRVRNLARILNSPFAIGLVTVSPAGYNFPTPHKSLTNGIDCMAKWYQGGSFTNSLDTFQNGFYIFANVRGSATQANISATFTVPDEFVTAHVIGESRSISIVGGSFTDTFATAYSSHIYRLS